MRSNKTPVRSLSSLAAILIFSALSIAQTTAQRDVSHVSIKNFGQMDERFYRGAQPKEEQFRELRELGITTVIDLQAEPKAYERQIVESLGMRYVNIPMVTKTYPKEEHVAAFKKLVDDPSTGKFYVHCAGGRHRTGSMGAVYRFDKYGWDYDRVYKEMKDYDFYTSWGHGDFKKFVQNYAESVKSHVASTPGASPAAATAQPAGHAQR